MDNTYFTYKADKTYFIDSAVTLLNRYRSSRTSHYFICCAGLTLLGLLISAAAIGTADASPLARIHVKFVQPPHVQEYGLKTEGARVISQQSYLSIGRRHSPPNLRTGSPVMGGYYYPRPRTIPRAFAPVEQNDINVSNREYSHQTPDFSNGLDYPDPLLLTGEAALRAVRYIYGRGELFFSDIPHTRAILRNQQERRENGLNGNILRSIRPNSPFYDHRD
ncbi:uncharacterized protein LOC100118543 isoform X1 [Nasonia vitripennis]|uniref:Uncharacterized protein n=1 Tax=Nasonia vitripennis TaxID=7425 RepID=A0A7M7IXI3_NASVI|nr:uncharacterized protein LOC100118543 isoform X1 [Nasonia vitripennis]